MREAKNLKVNLLLIHFLNYFLASKEEPYTSAGSQKQLLIFLHFFDRLSGVTLTEIVRQNEIAISRHKTPALRAFRFPGLKSLNHQLIKLVFFV